MYGIREKQLIMQLEEFDWRNEKFNIKTGVISFKSDSESLSTDFARIDFNFTGINANTPIGVMYIDNLTVDLRTMKIRSWCKSIYEYLELGTMEKFQTPEEALAILEKFIDDIKEKK